MLYILRMHVKTYIEETGISQAEFSRRSGIPQGHLSQLVNNLRKAEPDTMTKLRKGSDNKITVRQMRPDFFMEIEQGDNTKESPIGTDTNTQKDHITPARNGSGAGAGDSQRTGAINEQAA